MNSKVNLKARIKRHSKLLKEDLTNIHPFMAMYHKISYRFVILVFVFILPIYPVFSNFFYTTSKYDFYRGDIDTSSILESYDEETDTSDGYSSTDNGFVIVNAPLEDSRDRDGVNEIIEYKVLEGDSFDSIAKKFQVSTNSIYWANNFSFNKNIETGEIIKVPSISGLLHTVEKRDTLDSISAEYGIGKDKIMAQNNIKSEESLLEEGTTLLIPGAQKFAPASTTASTTTGGYTFVNSLKSGQSKDVSYDGIYPLVKRTPSHSFVWGNCTYFVAQYKDVTWGGNAKDWLKNAQAAGVSTGNNPGVGAIVVLYGRGYNPRYGHVAIVVDVKVDSIIVKDMNYRRLNEVTVREIPKDDAAIQGYIYAK